MSKTSSAVKNRYNEKAYDRINLTVKKGGKQHLQKAAATNKESINGYIKLALKERLLADLKQDVDL